eukprot:162681_1
MPSRSSKARKSKVQCKTCWDNGNITAQYSIDYLKNNHGPQQNGPRRPTDRKKKIPHPVIELVPSQWVEYVHYYPISKKGKVITKPKRTSFFKTQTQLTSPTSFTKPHKPILPRPSSKASNMRGNTSNVSKRKRKRMDMENDIEDTSSNNQEQPRKKMKQCFEDALKASVEANKIVTINEIDNMMSGLDNDMTQMSKQQIIETQAQIIDSFAIHFGAQGWNVLDMHELAIREKLKGFAVKRMDQLFYYCSICATWIGSDLSGDWCTGYIISDDDMNNVHITDPERFRRIKASWTMHKRRPRHKDRIENTLSVRRKDRALYETEISVLETLFRVVLEMKISRIANWKYPLMLARKHKDGVFMETQRWCSTRERDLVSKPLICNTLQYKNGEKSGGAKELAAGYKKVFTMLGILSDIARRLKSAVFDNEYFEKRVVLQICLQYYLQKIKSFSAFRKKK